MAQLVVRRIDEGVKARLRRRAKRNGRSMEEEVRNILRCAVNENELPSGGLGTEISALFADAGLRHDIPELRGSHIKLPSFES
jgi:plasmid stability protein